MDNAFFDQPILNSPYDYPARHWELDDQGQPTHKIIDARRRAEFITPIPKPKKQKGAGVIDLSATPFFLRGSGYVEGTLFPWTMSDFSLMDAIECGIVKLPRVPISDNIPGGEMPMFRNLWEHIRSKMPKKGRGKAASINPLDLPPQLQTALEALYGHYTQTFELWSKAGISVPPCFIVVCNNTSTSKLVYDYISGFIQKHEDGSGKPIPGRLELFRNYDEHGTPLARPRTLLIDSEQLESGEGLDAKFRDIAGPEIEQFRREIFERGGRMADELRAGKTLDDSALLREVMNTVGKPGRLGDSIRCVVSVSMLTEGWDANTVPHVLGARAFGTQLLCEQVIGRALRRQSYDLNEDGRFNVEYADVLGIPFDFTASPVIAKPQPPRETIQVKAMHPERDHLEIRFPRVQGYRAELPEDRLTADFNDDSVMEISPNLVGAAETRNAGIIGAPVDLNLVHTGDVRPSQVLYELTSHLLLTRWRDADDQPQMHLFGQLKRLTQQWLKTCLVCKGGTYPAQLKYKTLADMASERITAAVTRSLVGQRPIKAVLDPYNPTGSTLHVNFSTSKDRSLGDRRRPLPPQLGHPRQRLGGRILPHRRAARARHRLRQEPQPRPGGALPLRLRDPDLPPGLHRSGRRRARPRGSSASHRRDQGLPSRGRQGEEVHHGYLLGAGREQPRHLRTLGLRRIHRRLPDAGGLCGEGGASLQRNGRTGDHDDR